MAKGGLANQREVKWKHRFPNKALFSPYSCLDSPTHELLLAHLVCSIGSCIFVGALARTIELYPRCQNFHSLELER